MEWEGPKKDAPAQVCMICEKRTKANLQVSEGGVSLLRICMSCVAEGMRWICKQSRAGEQQQAAIVPGSIAESVQAIVNARTRARQTIGEIVATLEVNLDRGNIRIPNSGGEELFRKMLRRWKEMGRNV